MGRVEEANEETTLNNFNIKAKRVVLLRENLEEKIALARAKQLKKVMSCFLLYKQCSGTG